MRNRLGITSFISYGVPASLKSEALLTEPVFGQRIKWISSIVTLIDSENSLHGLIFKSQSKVAYLDLNVSNHACFQSEWNVKFVKNLIHFVWFYN